MNIRNFAIVAAFSVVTAFGQGILPALSSDSAFAVRYASNLAIGDSVINFSNAGTSSTADLLLTGGAQNGDICANIYAYSPDEQLVSCCSCNVTPNALNSLSVKNDLASNTLTPIIPSALVIKVLATQGGTFCTANRAATVTLGDLRVGLLAWGTTIHALPVTAGSPATTYGVTETAFEHPYPTPIEVNRMTSLCSFIRANGSGYGICKSCKVGGLGAASK